MLESENLNLWIVTYAALKEKASQVYLQLRPRGLTLHRSELILQQREFAIHFGKTGGNQSLKVSNILSLK